MAVKVGVCSHYCRMLQNCGKQLKYHVMNVLASFKDEGIPLGGFLYETLDWNKSLLNFIPSLHGKTTTKGRKIYILFYSCGNYMLEATAPLKLFKPAAIKALQNGQRMCSFNWWHKWNRANASKFLPPTPAEEINHSKPIFPGRIEENPLTFKGRNCS